MLLEEARCRGCGQTFLRVNNENGMYCASCGSLAARPVAIADSDVGRCPRCYRTFQRKALGQRFCSESCRKGRWGVRYG